MHLKYFITLILYLQIVSTIGLQNQINFCNFSDVNKMPIGKLSTSQIAKGLDVLMDIEKSIKNNEVRSLSSNY